MAARKVKAWELYNIGTCIKVGPAKMDGKITAICIRGSVVTYEVVWWDDTQRYCEWLYITDFELSSEYDCNKLRINLGFTGITA